MTERELLLSWRPWLRVTAANMTSDDPESLSQEGWVAIWRALPDYDGRAPFEPWVKTVARNRMRNVIRDSHAARRDIRRVDHYPDVADVCDVAIDLAGVEMAYHHGEIRAAIDALNPRQREYVLARFWGGLTYNELNARFETKQSNAAIWKRVRRQLAEQLAHLAVAA